MHPGEEKETPAVAGGDLSERSGGPPEEDLPNEGWRRRLQEAASTPYSGARGAEAVRYDIEVGGSA